MGALTRRGRRAQECIPTSLLKLTAENSGRAVKMFSAVQKYMGDAGEAPAGAAKLDLVMRLLAQARARLVSFSAPYGLTVHGTRAPDGATRAAVLAPAGPQGPGPAPPRAPLAWC